MRCPAYQGNASANQRLGNCKAGKDRCKVLHRYGEKNTRHGVCKKYTPISSLQIQTVFSSEAGSLVLEEQKGINNVMNWRLASRLSVVTLALLVVVTVALLGAQHISGQAAAPPPGTVTADPQGTDLGGIAAPGFQLTDQFGKPFSLTQFLGKPVVITFMYTHCPDVCPLMAEKLHRTMLNLGSSAQQIGVIAISVDPLRDTVAAALQFSQAHQMTSYWHYLVGTKTQLAPVWTSYAIGSQVQTATQSMHTAVLYLLDKQGHEQTLLDQDFTAPELTGDLQALLKKSA